MNKVLGIFGLLVFICLFTTLLSTSFDSPQNLYNVTRWSALYGILSIGAAFVIITGGIDLSVGSLVCLVGCLLATFIMDYGWSIYFSIAVVMVLSVWMGLAHGLLVTKLKMQPFVVTLGGFLIYRGLARWYCEDKPMGFLQEHDKGLRQLALGKPWIGYEQNLAVLAGVGGTLLFIFLLIRAIWQSKNRLPAQWASWRLLPFALIVAVAGLSQFLGSEDARMVLKISNYSIPIEPKSLFYHLGFLAFIPCCGTFLLSGLWTHFRRNALPIALLVVVAACFTGVAWKVAPTYAELSPGAEELHDFWFLSVSEGILRYLIMAIVFVVTAGFTCVIGWVVASVTRDNLVGKAILLPTVFGGTIWLLGMTTLPDTPIPMPLLILIACGLVASIFLNQTVYGRYMLALGRNEEAARYSGINTDRITILAYLICSTMAGLAAILFAVEINNLQPANHGFLFELYAIAAAVLGGCSLRGGEGTIVGVIIGAAVVRLLYNVINTLGIDTKLEMAVIGVVILAGVIADETIKRVMAAKRRRLQLEN